LGLNTHPYAYAKLKQPNLCTARRQRQMLLPNGSIANLSVTRKTFDASNDEKLVMRALRSRSRSDSRGCARLGKKRGEDRNRSQKIKKSRRLKGAGVGSKRLFAPRSAAIRSPDYFWMLA
jgi:hypothetical protein